MPDVVALNKVAIQSREYEQAQDRKNALVAEMTSQFRAMDMAREQRDERVQIALYAIIIAIAAAGVIIYWVYDRRTLKPFRDLQEFATEVARGNLEAPLRMDRDNNFGAFTEAFDLMRTELQKAQVAERLAQESKKELVAQLSHDIKTPIASIMAITEVIELKVADKDILAKLEFITSKARLVDSLITDMFQSTLEELQALKVEPAEIKPSTIRLLIEEADYDKKIRPFKIPDAICYADPLRLRQVLDNIISNSYKYAGTTIQVDASLEGESLILAIRDFGSGVPAEELESITEKFYRGSNAEGSDGYGIGLFTSQYLMKKMGGDLYCENLSDGFAVKLIIRQGNVW